MEKVEDLYAKIEKQKIKLFRIGFSADALKTANDLLTIDNFFDFVHFQNIQTIFGTEIYDDAEDYFITENVIVEAMGRYATKKFAHIVENEIKQYNEAVSKINFTIPYSYIISCLYEGKCFYVNVKINRNVDESFLTNPDEKMQEIIAKNENTIAEERNETKKVVEKLKKELKEIIVHDNKFLLCTNRQMRFNYIKELLTNGLNEKFEPLKELWLADTLRGIYQEPIDFVELIWRELK